MKKWATRFYCSFSNKSRE